MSFRLDNWILWDFWLAPRQLPTEPYHLFFLQAPRSLANPELRHDLATVGHATSPNLRNWEYHGTALEPGLEGTWDDLSIWTGCVVRHDNRWVMFYTGRSTREAGRVQRIGLVVSADLHEWKRVIDRPVLTADGRWYRIYSPGVADMEDCRDPWVIRQDDRWLIYYTASDRDAADNERGVVGCAESRDLIEWRSRPPIIGPGRFGEIEVPQLVQVGRSWIFVFCTAKHAKSAPEADSRWIGTHYFVAHDPLGPFKIQPGPPLLADEAGTRYAGRIVNDPWNGLHLLAWRCWDESGRFAGDLIDPIGLVVEPGDTVTLRLDT
jgi:beta-fructofuranosidase